MEVNNLCQGRQLNLDISLNDRQNNNLEVKNSYVKNDVKNTVDKKYSKDCAGKKDLQDSVDRKDLQNSVDKLNGFLKNENVHIEYEIHEKLKDLMIKIVDDDTKEIIKEIPPKKILDMVAKMCEMVGIIVDKKV